MSNFEIGAVVFLVFVVIGFVTGGSHRKMRMEAAEEAARMAEADERTHKMKQEIIEAEKKELIRQRNAHLDYIRGRNALYLKNTGVVWTNETEAMKKYDRQWYNEWKAVGMTPPSFVK